VAAHALVVDAPLRQFFVAGPNPASGVLALVAVAAAAGVAAVYARPWTADLPSAEGMLGFLAEPAGLAAASWRERRIGSLWAALALVLYAASLDLLQTATSFEWGHVAVRGLLAAAAVGLVACAGTGWRRHLAWGGHALLGVLVLLVVATDTLSTSANWGYALLITAGALLTVLLIDELRRDEDPAISWAPPVLAPLSLAGAVAAAELLVHGHDAPNVALLAIASLYAALACIVPRRNTSTALWAPALVVALYAATELLDGTLLVLAITATAAAIVTLGEVVGERRLQLASAGLLLVALGHVLVVDAPPRDFFVANAHPASGTLAIAALVAAGAVFSLTGFAGEDPRWRRIAGAATAVLALYGLSLAILGGFEWHGVASVATNFQRGHTAVSAVWGVLGLLILVAGLRRRSPALRATGFVLLGVSLAKLFLYDLAALSSVTRALSFLAVGAVLLLGGFLYQRLARDDDGGPLPAH
jgi:hypothetical protein